jgi:hypothetical protein
VLSWRTIKKIKCIEITKCKKHHKNFSEDLFSIDKNEGHKNDRTNKNTKKMRVL